MRKNVKNGQAGRQNGGLNTMFSSFISAESVVL